MRTIDDAVIVVTGAARGIGRTCTEHFVAAGARVVALNRSWTGAEEFRESLDATGRVVTATLDITDAEGLAELCAKSVERFGTIDVLVNNAAMRQRVLYPPAGATTVLQTLDEHWHQMFDVNVVGTLKVVRAFVAPMIAQRRGAIINIGSRGDVMRRLERGVWQGGHPGLRNQPYEATKVAMYSMSFYLSEELREHNIAVNLAFPGATRTTGSDEVMAAWKAQSLDARMPPLLKPEHMMPLIEHLALNDVESGPTGMGLDAVQWNRNHGHGDTDAWLATQ